MEHFANYKDAVDLAPKIAAEIAILKPEKELAEEDLKNAQSELLTQQNLLIIYLTCNG